MLAFIIVALSILLDQITKYAAQNFLKPLSGGVDIINGIVSFTYTENKGAAFGILQNQQWLFFIVTIPAIILISYYIWFKKPNKTITISLALILSGAIGNLIDRAFLTYVRDFIYFEFINFPIFNVADSVVTIGSTILIIKLLFGKEQIYNDLKSHELKQEEEING